ncbi:TPA: HEPN domain-containing protein [Stenotrophomonas maltophilia]
MDPIIAAFEADLDKIAAQLDFMESVRRYIGVSVDLVDSDSLFLKESLVIHDDAKKIHSNIPLAGGTLILYVCGRFESMSRTLFEDLCQRLVTRAQVFSRLPKKMRENLPVFTAKVVAEPRRYGHAENGVRAFVTTLASNLAVDARVDRVNHECLSLTESNMRADVLAELFGRIGGANIWIQMAEQASLKAYFQEAETAKVEAAARRKLNDLMELRNKIAHPSSELDWPSGEALRDYLKFLRLLARAMVDLTGVYEVTLCAADSSTAKNRATA